VAEKYWRKKMNLDIRVENIKCGGCANSIEKKIRALSGVLDVVVDIENGKVVVSGESLDRDKVVQELTHMGYPETGSVEGLKAAATKAKSYVSCAIGKMS
jgi:copper chaperone